MDKPKISRKHQFTPESLKEKSREQIEDLRARAIKFEAQDLVEMCDLDLQRRDAEKKAKAISVKSPASGIVIGYHFVCSSDRGVLKDGNGQFRSGSWVVSEDRVQESLKHGAYLALHESKSEPSYRQGRIIGYEKTLKDMINRDNWGIEFLVQEDDEPRGWVGDGSGEKGYNWSKALTSK